MHSSTFGIFVFVLFAYNTLTQGQTFTVDKVVFKNGLECITDPAQGVNASLIKLLDKSYEIRETRSTGALTWAIFQVEDFHTMIWNTVILATNVNTLQIQFRSVYEAQQLFELAGRDILHWKLYMYKLTAVYEYGKDCVLRNGSISGFGNAVSSLSSRHVIHTGGMRQSKFGADPNLNPYIFGTAYGFNYCVYDERSIVVTLFKSNDRTYSYYLVKFTRPDELFTWKVNHGDFISSEIPEAIADPDIISYFNGVYIRTD